MGGGGVVVIVVLVLIVVAVLVVLVVKVDIATYLDVRNKSSADPQSLVLRDTHVDHICCLACW